MICFEGENRYISVQNLRKGYCCDTDMVRGRVAEGKLVLIGGGGGGQHLSIPAVSHSVIYSYVPLSRIVTILLVPGNVPTDGFC